MRDYFGKDIQNGDVLAERFPSAMSNPKPIYVMDGKDIKLVISDEKMPISRYNKKNTKRLMIIGKG